MKTDNQCGSTRQTYEIQQYLEITGGQATAIDMNSKSEHTGWSKRNIVLAEIISGEYGNGYNEGTDGGYTAAQRALYYYLPKWLKEVGTEGGLGISTDWMDKDKYEDNGVGQSIYQEVWNKYYTGQSEEFHYKTVRIYFLWCKTAANFQRLILVDVEPRIPDEEEYDGYIVIEGKVWAEGENGKADTINGKYDKGDTLLDKIQVTIKDADGGSFPGKTTTETDANGQYKLIINYYEDSPNNPYHLLEQFSQINARLMNGAYVEFKYDGTTYTTVKYATSGADTSRAKESSSSRKDYDKNNTYVDPNSIEPSGKVKATTKDVIQFSNYAHKEEKTQKRYNKWCTGQSAGGNNVKYKYTNPAKDMSHEVLEGITTTHDSCSNWNTCHLVKAGYDYTCKRVVVENEGTEYENRYTEECGTIHDDKPGSPCGGYESIKSIHNHDEDIYCIDTGKEHSIESMEITYLKITEVNLGLFRREQPDIALESDIQKVDVTMNDQKYTYIYNEKGIEHYKDDKFKPKVKFQNKYTYTYRKPVNPANVADINAGNGYINIEVTYKVLLRNQSSTLPVKVHKLKNFYDTEYTIATGKWTDIENKEKYKIATIDDLDISIAPGKNEIVYITYSISPDAIKGLIKQDATLNNVFEIYAYSTQYGNSTLYAEQQTGGRNNNAYAGRDSDSKPGNAEIWYNKEAMVNGKKEPRLDIKENSIEDDTDIAPSFVLVLDQYKVIEGTVYEDMQTGKSAENKERLGNGVKEDNEKGLANVKVELLHSDTKELAKMYKIIDRKTGKKQAIDAVTWTDENGNFSFGDTSTQGVVVDDYIIRYTYGNNDIKGDGTNLATTLNGQPINARNFKSTIVTQEPIKGVLQGSNNSKRWHLDTTDNTTVAVDNLELRAAEGGTDKTPLKYANYDQAFNISADSARFDLQVEYTDETIADVDENGLKKKGLIIEGNAVNGFKHIITTFDFGIIERPREDLIIDKTVSKLKLTLANGQVLIDGDPRVESLDYTKALGVRKPSEDAKERNRKEKLISIEMDAEYIQGATLETWYEITATNNNEKDYDYSSDPKYYYYGENKGLSLIDTTIPYVVDYLDPELVCTVEKGNEEKAPVNPGWEIITADELKTNGYISEETYKKLKEKNYLIFRTNAFDKGLPTGSSCSISLYASKLLANKDDKLEYENHTEIISINGKVARTINSIEDETRNQINKTYIPGDYTLLREYHQQDDDMVKIVITPPTGLEDMIITYISIAAIALSVIGVGVYIIKKKVLK